MAGPLKKKKGEEENEKEKVKEREGRARGKRSSEVEKPLILQDLKRSVLRSIFHVDIVRCSELLQDTTCTAKETVLVQPQYSAKPRTSGPTRYKAFIVQYGPGDLHCRMVQRGVVLYCSLT